MGGSHLRLFTPPMTLLPPPPQAQGGQRRLPPQPPELQPLMREETQGSSDAHPMRGHHPRKGGFGDRPVGRRSCPPPPTSGSDLAPFRTTYLGEESRGEGRGGGGGGQEREGGEEESSRLFHCSPIFRERGQRLLKAAGAGVFRAPCEPRSECGISTRRGTSLYARPYGLGTSRAAAIT